METQLEIAFDLSFLAESDYRKIYEQCCEVRRLLNGLIESLRTGKR